MELNTKSPEKGTNASMKNEKEESMSGHGAYECHALIRQATVARLLRPGATSMQEQ